jgi:hypothetical protein
MAQTEEEAFQQEGNILQLKARLHFPQFLGENFHRGIGQQGDVPSQVVKVLKHVGKIL